MAARMSTASRPSRKTRIAELVTTVALLALSPSVAAASASCSSSASRASRSSRRGARSAISFARPGWPDGAEPDRALDVEREPGVERLQPPLGPELEERVRLEPRLLGLAVLAGAGRRLHAVERERDQVVVGLVGALLPRLGHRRVQRVLDALGLGLDLVGGRHALALLGGDADQPAEPVDPVRGRLGARRVALGELVAQVGEGGRGAGAEGDRLLDLEVERARWCR